MGRLMVDVSCDFGGSLTKVVGSCLDRVFCFSIAPELIEVTRRLEPDGGGYSLAKNLWVSNGSVNAAIGELARKEFCATIPLVQPKSEHVVARSMGVVAVIADLLRSTHLDLNLRCLLPAAEYGKETKALLKQELIDNLAEFSCPIGKVKAKLKSFKAIPEGMGLVKHFTAFSRNYYSLSSVAVAVFGYRNTSMFSVRGGRPTLFRSNSYGFVRAMKFAGVSQVDAISNPSIVNPDAVREYWTANKNWLLEEWPDGIEALVVGGGPLASIETQAIEFFKALLPTPIGESAPVILIDGGFPSRNSYGFKYPDEIALQLTAYEKRQFADVFCDWRCDQLAKTAA
jgi:hypothetical protein